MDRRKAIAVAGTVGVTLAAATAAVFANVSLLSGQEGPDGVGELDAQSVAQLVAEEPTTTAAPATTIDTPSTTVVYVDEYVTVPAGSPAAGAPSAPTAAGAPSLPGVAAEHVAALDPAPPAAAPAPTAHPATAPAPADSSYGDEYEDDEHEDEGYEDSEDDDHEDEVGESHEYEDDDD